MFLEILLMIIIKCFTHHSLQKKPYLRTNYIEANIEEDFDLENQYKFKKLPDSVDIREPAYIDIIFRNDIDFNDVKLENIKFVKVNYQPTVNEHSTPKIYVDNAIDEPSLVRSNQNNDFNNQNSTDMNSITLNTQAVNDNQVITKAYVVNFHQENERYRRDLGIDF